MRDRNFANSAKVPIHPNSRADATDSRYNPMLVGEVRFATTAFGTSWKLSGGNMFCSAVTKVSKKLQVWRAMMRRRCRSSTDKLSRRARRAGQVLFSPRGGEIGLCNEHYVRTSRPATKVAGYYREVR